MTSTRRYPSEFRDVRHGMYDPEAKPGVLAVLPAEALQAWEAVEAARSARYQSSVDEGKAHRAVIAHGEAVARADRVGIARPPAADLEILEDAHRRAVFLSGQAERAVTTAENAYVAAVVACEQQIGANAAAKLTEANAATVTAWDAFLATFDTREVLFNLTAGTIADEAEQINLHRQHWRSQPGPSRIYQQARDGWLQIVNTRPDHEAAAARSADKAKAKAAQQAAQDAADARQRTAEDARDEAIHQRNREAIAAEAKATNSTNRKAAK